MWTHLKSALVISDKRERPEATTVTLEQIPDGQVFFYGYDKNLGPYIKLFGIALPLRNGVQYCSITTQFQNYRPCEAELIIR